jgi:outer membrane usher protein
MRTLRVGDAVTPYGSWGRSLRFGGVQFGTNFATRPEEITFPQPTIEGTAAVASALDIFVNGSLSSRTEVPSGAFQIDNVPIVTGAGQIQVVTRDLMGREQIVTQDFYVSERLLRRGLNEYSVSAGAVRDDYGIASSEYGDFLVAGVFRRGLSDSLTLEGRVEGTADAQAAGVSVARAMGLYGITSAAVAISQGTRSGSLWQVGHEYQGRVFRASMRVQGSRRFAQPGFSLLAGWPELQIVASGGRGFGRKGSLGASYVEERFADAANDRKLVTLTYSRSLSRTFVLAASASQISARNGGSAATITVNRALGPRSSASATAYARNGDTTLRLDHRYELPAGPGFGYRTSFSEGAERRRAAEVAVNTKHARYYVEGAQYGDARGWRLGTRGSVAILDGDMFAAREINDGFAVVDAGGFEGVRVYLENREIGTTDRHGRLLVPSLRPYETNRLRIEAADLPLTARIDDSGMQVAPYYRSGALARFGIEDGSSVLVRVVTDDGLPVAEGARGRVGDGPFDYPVGLDGRLYLQAGHGAHVEIANGGELLCSFALPEVYDQSQGIPDLGEVVCR